MRARAAVLLALTCAAPGSAARGATLRLPASAAPFPFETRAKAIAGHRTHSDRFLLLGGVWRVRRFATHRDARAAEAPERDDADWATVTMPADAGSVTPPASRAAGPATIVYRRAFDAPAGWRGSDVILHIDAASSPYTVRLNGRRVGGSAATTLPVDYAVTRLIHPGRNVLTIRRELRRRGADAVGDRPPIAREIFVMAAPRPRLRDVVVDAGLADDGTSGTLALDLAVTAGPAVTARFILLDGARHLSTGDATLAARGAPRRVTLHGQVPGVTAWRAERPALYLLLVELATADGRVIESGYQRIGFRPLSRAGGSLRVGGCDAPLRPAPPPPAPITDRAAIEPDVRSIKAAGFNAIDSARYDDDPRLYDLADRYGLYVVGRDGAATIAPGIDARFARARNHPSVVRGAVARRDDRRPRPACRR